MTFPIRYGTTLNHSLCPCELFQVYFVILGEFPNDSNPGSISAKEINCTFKSEDRAYRVQGSSETGEDRTIVDAACDDACVEEGFLEGGFGEGWMFIGLNILFVDEVEFAGIPVNVVDDSIDVVEKNVGIAVDTFKEVDIRIVVPVGKLRNWHFSDIAREEYVPELWQMREQLCNLSRLHTISPSNADPIEEDRW